MIDFHTRSTASDGTLSPATLVDLAADKGLAAIALTDHDTVAGIPAAMECGKRRGVTVYKCNPLLPRNPANRWRNRSSTLLF